MSFARSLLVRREASAASGVCCYDVVVVAVGDVVAVDDVASPATN